MLRVTWNVNSLEARMPRVLESSSGTARRLCLQETECEDSRLCCARSIAEPPPPPPQRPGWHRDRSSKWTRRQGHVDSEAAAVW